MQRCCREQHVDRRVVAPATARGQLGDRLASTDPRKQRLERFPLIGSDDRGQPARSTCAASG
jgi:hypothetical protein